MTMTAAPTPPTTSLPLSLSDEQVRQFHIDGYLILPNVIGADDLAALRAAADATVTKVDRSMEARGQERIGLNLKGVRYFSINPGFEHPGLYQFSFGDMMAGFARQLLGDSVYAFWEQFVIKGPEPSAEASFSWHQDSAYVGFPHPRYLTCWCALDAMSEANGTARILPFGRGPSERVDHRKDEATNDLIGYDGDDAGDPIICPAGSIALFTSHTMHSSGANPSEQFRRVYLIQYSSEILQKPEEYKPYGRCEPLWINGTRVLKPA